MLDYIRERREGYRLKVVEDSRAQKRSRIRGSTSVGYLRADTFSIENVRNLSQRVVDGTKEETSQGLMIELRTLKKNLRFMAVFGD